MAILSNNSTYLTTFGISGAFPFHAWHPSVIDFLTEFGLAGWNGHRFVGGFTSGELCDPYELAENAYLQYSDDGETWAGLIQASETGVCDYEIQESTGADTALVYNRWTQKLYIYWLHETPTPTAILTRREILANWTLGPAVECNTGLPAYGHASPAFHCTSAGVMHVWYVYNLFAGTANYEIYHSISTDGGITWATPVLCSENFITTAFPGYHPWHLDIKVNPWEPDVIEMVVATMISAGGWAGMMLVHCRTKLSTPTVFTVPLTTHLLDPGTSGNFDDTGLYRSTFTLYRDGDQLGMNLWYNGMDNPSETMPQIGYTSGLLGLTIYATTAVRADSLITLTSWTGATIYCKWDDGEYQEYLAPVADDGGDVFYYYSEDVNFTETVQSLNVGATIFDRLGNPLTRTDRLGNPITSAPRGQ